MRNFAGHEYSFVVAIGMILVGANIMMPSGISTSLPSLTMNVFLFSSSVPVSSSKMPSSLATRWTAGLSVRNESEPPSTMNVPRPSGSSTWSVASFPPSRSSFSTSTKSTSWPASAARRIL